LPRLLYVLDKMMPSEQSLRVFPLFGSALSKPVGSEFHITFVMFCETEVLKLFMFYFFLDELLLMFSYLFLLEIFGVMCCYY